MKSYLKISSPAGGQSGMTLMEMIIGLAIGTVIMAVAMSLLVFGARSLSSLGNYDDLNRKSRNALDLMTKDIREAHHLTSYISNSTVQRLIFTNMPGAAVSTFSYNYTNVTGTNGTLTRTWGAQNTLLLSNILNMSFNFSQRNPSNNFTFYTAGTNTANTKLIDVSWDCSRRVGGVTYINSESIQTAKIVVRN